MPERGEPGDDDPLSTSPLSPSRSRTSAGCVPLDSTKGPAPLWAPLRALAPPRVPAPPGRLALGEYTT
jgi:hypothetical protein